MSALLARAEDLYERVRTCDLCPLARTRTLSVPGEGPLTAEVMCIGEAPGANEDKQGRPFVGNAGQFLEELLAAGGLTRPEVYIANVLKCRPPSNRDPAPGEIQACADYLGEQIALVDPLVVVTLGRFSMAPYFPGQTISRIHGQYKIIAGRYVVPMYHPAAALHQASLRDVLKDDFRKLPRILDLARASRAPRMTPEAVVATAPNSQPAAPGPSPAARSPEAFPSISRTEPQQTRLFE